MVHFRNEKKFGLFCPNDNKTTPGSESGTHHGRHTCEFKGQDLKMAAAVDFAGESSQSNLKGSVTSILSLVSPHTIIINNAEGTRPSIHFDCNYKNYIYTLQCASID